MTGSRFFHLFIILLLAMFARFILLASGSVSFHADEAVVGLMARHILQGERPVFFYGQAYMGSLDAWLIAIGFRLLGESVLMIRVVQSFLYLLVVAAGYLAAWRLSGRPVVAAVAGLALAVPTVNVALYTTATLGGYNELLILGSLILLLGYEVLHDHPRSAWRWALLGLCAGLGWWTHGLSVVYAVPVGLMVLYRLFISPRSPLHEQKRSERQVSSPSPQVERGSGGEVYMRAHHALLLQTIPFLALAFITFLIGSAPWWVFDLQSNGAALSTFLTNRQTGQFEGIGLPYVPPQQRALGLLLVGLPALIGLRFPWSSGYFLLPLGALVVLVYLVAGYRLLRICNPLKPDARALILGMIGLFLLIFVASSFGADPTGRYFLPLALPMGMILGTLLDGLCVGAQHAPPLHNDDKTIGTRNIMSLQSCLLAIALGVLVIGYQAAGQIAAAAAPPGFTTQFDPVSHIPNNHDSELIAFLEQHHLYNGFTNYWVAFRLAFLSGERLQYSAALPYKTNLDYNPADNRYRAYADAAARADRVAYITTNLPELDRRLETAFQEQDITYQQQVIGPFHIYYDFEPYNPEP